MKKRIVRSAVLIFFAVLSSRAQKTMVHGKIVAFNKFPVENVEISIKKKKVVTTTDSLGFFSIKSQLKDKIFIEAKGFKPVTIKVKNVTDSIKVNLVFGGSEKDIEIATGYGHMKKKNLVYAITHLPAENNDSVNYRDIIEMIRAKAPGVTMMGGKFQVRGITSLTGNTGALIIVNGLETDMVALKNIPVQDVKSIDVLKGAAASIYGSRGGNGVIVITLKS